MMKRLLVSAVLLTALAVGAGAQSVKLGVKGGVDVAEAKFSQDVFNTDNKLGWFAGLTLKVSLPAGFGIDISGLYNQREAKVNDVYNANTNQVTDTKLKQKQVIVPLNVRYSIGLGSAANIFVYAGPQVGFNVGDSGQNIFQDTAEWRLSDSNFSVNGGAGLTLGPVQLSANYNVGVGKTGEVKFKNATQALGDGLKGHYNSWQIALAYFF